MNKSIPFYLAALFCLTPWVSSPTALVVGFLLASLGLVPENVEVGKITKKLLAYSIVGLGFGIQFEKALAVTGDGIGLIITTIIGTLVIGWFLAKRMGLDRTTGYLISSGTAICGGSAIAAMAPVIKAKQHEIAMSLAIVFLLNGLALLVFPAIGHYFQLTQEQFAIWAALAVHDTSSVVATASTYGPVAVGIATTVKLTRAMWIIPYTALAGVFWKSEEKTSIPLFIVGFLLAALINTYLPEYSTFWQLGYAGAKHVLYACLFLVGSGVSLPMLKQTGWRPLAMATLLWVIVSSVILLLIIDGVIN